MLNHPIRRTAFRTDLYDIVSGLACVQLPIEGEFEHAPLLAVPEAPAHPGGPKHHPPPLVNQGWLEREIGEKGVRVALDSACRKWYLQYLAQRRTKNSQPFCSQQGTIVDVLSLGMWWCKVQIKNSISCFRHKKITFTRHAYQKIHCRIRLFLPRNALGRIKLCSPGSALVSSSLSKIRRGLPPTACPCPRTRRRSKGEVNLVLSVLRTSRLPGRLRTCPPS